MNISAFVVIFAMVVSFSVLATGLGGLFVAIEKQKQGISNRLRMALVEQELKNSLVVDPETGVSYPPRGNAGVYYMLPNLSASQVTANGTPMLYCPYVPGQPSEGGLTDTVESPSGFSYSASIREINGKQTITGTDQVLPGVFSTSEVVAAIVAPVPGSVGVPDCNDVSLDGGQYVVNGGVVRVVKRPGGFLKIAEERSRAFRWFVKKDGVGSGSSSSDASDLNAAFRYWRTREPAKMEVVLLGSGLSGLMKVNDLNLKREAVHGWRRSGGVVRWVGGRAGGGSRSLIVVVDNFGGNRPGRFELDGEHIFEHVGFATADTIVVGLGDKVRLLADSTVEKVFVEGGTLIVEDSSVSQIEVRGGGSVIVRNGRIQNILVDGGEVYLGDGTVVSGDNARPEAVLVRSGGLSVSGAVEIKGRDGSFAAFVGSGGRLIIEPNADVDFTRISGSLSSAVFVESGGVLVVDRAAVAVPQDSGKGFEIYGVGRFVGSSVDFGAGVGEGARLWGGSVFSLEDGAVFGRPGFSPIVGVADYGAKLVSGRGAVIGGQWVCWNGGAFRGSATGLNGAGSRVNNTRMDSDLDETRRRGSWLKNRSDWLCKAG